MARLMIVFALLVSFCGFAHAQKPAPRGLKHSVNRVIARTIGFTAGAGLATVVGVKELLKGRRMENPLKFGAAAANKLVGHYNSQQR